jgi:hypothetical protein
MDCLSCHLASTYCSVGCLIPATHPATLALDALHVQAASNGPPSSVKVDAYRQVKAGVWEWWSTYSLQFNTDSPAEAVSSSAGGNASSRSPANENHPRQISSSVGNIGGEAGAAAEQPAAVKGQRHRLLPLSESLQRALPADGKLTVLYGGHTCEAQLSLPTSETRCAAALFCGCGHLHASSSLACDVHFATAACRNCRPLLRPCPACRDTSGLATAMWLTVGGLAGSGLALQLKLKRLDKPSERDKEAGGWYSYVPIGGALAVRDGLLDA